VLAVLDRALGGAIRRLVDECAVLRCGRLEAGGCVDHVARSHPLTGIGPRRERDERLAGRHADADLELAFLARPVADRERRAHGPLRVVVVRGRGAEERHDGVADELLDGAAVPLELRAESLVVGTQEGLDVLRIELLGTRREPHQIDEEHRHDLSLAARFVRHVRYLSRSTW
jgi:hypothetical protein